MESSIEPLKYQSTRHLNNSSLLNSVFLLRKDSLFSKDGLNHKNTINTNIDFYKAIRSHKHAQELIYDLEETWNINLKMIEFFIENTPELQEKRKTGGSNLPPIPKIKQTSNDPVNTNTNSDSAPNKPSNSNKETNELIAIVKRINHLYLSKKQKHLTKAEIKTKLLIEKQVGEEVSRRHKEDVNVFNEEEEELDQTCEKKVSLSNQYDKKFIEVQIYARREFVGKHPDPEFYLFNMNRFILKNVAMHYDIKNSKAFLSSLINEIVNTKETFIYKKDISHRHENSMIMTTMRNKDESVLESPSTRKRVRHSSMIEAIKETLPRREQEKGRTIGNSNIVVYNTQSSIDNKDSGVSINFTKKQLRLINMLDFNLRIIERIERLKFTYKYFTDYRFAGRYIYNNKPAKSDQTSSNKLKDINLDNKKEEESANSKDAKRENTEGNRVNTVVHNKKENAEDKEAKQKKPSTLNPEYCSLLSSDKAEPVNFMSYFFKEKLKGTDIYKNYKQNIHKNSDASSLEPDKLSSSEKHSNTNRLSDNDEGKRNMSIFNISEVFHTKNNIQVENLFTNNFLDHGENLEEPSPIQNRMQNHLDISNIENLN
eukprot:CAMPEP_0170537978 /NCGR_PEP_ID=MMETSP0209-20121228/103038_1 /TAXON_ID=665100 ORGANISM="Litonotus pictus, Strain P1" /NCGR_SAMPLE_ID=MMETSP0209 /ASSEMBLY_ACC=CAM_ASM_000301 /LENGTH=597 /DNA_ID=CAMNT_0010839581 /DNA_START=35 /DNA_END=1825 /DNA_ORIENTATION=-